jgi:hypothetical protein
MYYIIGAMVIGVAAILILSKYSKTDKPEEYEGEESDQRIPHIDDYRDMWKKKDAK